MNNVRFGLQKSTRLAYGLQAYFSGSMPKIWWLLWNLEKDSKMQKFKYFQEPAGNLCSKRLRYGKIKKQILNIQSTNEFGNAVPYLKAVAKFRQKTFMDSFFVFFLYFDVFIFLSSDKIQIFGFLQKNEY